MTEREMEDLIAQYPEDFFPDRGFTLKGRQQSFAGVGRFDLLFEDRFNTNILMELKAVPAKYDVATQLAKYRDEMLSRGQKHILMWLVAPQIPTSVREFLDRIGIEYSEIHEAEFRRTAQRHGVSSPPDSDRREPQIAASPENNGPQRAETSLERSPLVSGRQLGVIYGSFTELMESAVLPQHEANPNEIRLDGQRTGPNGRGAYWFRHHGRVWQINFDTHYAPLELAYAEVKEKGKDHDPFVEMPTTTRNGESKNLRLKLRQGSKNMFIYLTKRT